MEEQTSKENIFKPGDNVMTPEGPGVIIHDDSTHRGWWVQHQPAGISCWLPIDLSMIVNESED